MSNASRAQRPADSSSPRSSLVEPQEANTGMAPEQGGCCGQDIRAHPSRLRGGGGHARLRLKSCIFHCVTHLRTQ